jgi:hypothetical protein
MNRMTLALAAAMFAAPVAWAEDTNGFGTKINFVENPKDAAAQAKKKEKLVLVLHVSGYFEDPALT